MLIGVEGTKTPAGVRGRGDSKGAKRRGGSPLPPAESEVPGTEINRLVKRTIFSKKLCHENTEHSKYNK